MSSADAFADVDAVARAVLYEGYLLYPYRLSALKNRHRWLFGRLLPRDDERTRQGAESSSAQFECLLAGTPQTALEVKVRFLQLVAHGDVADPQAAGGCDSDSSPEAVEREAAAAVRLAEIVEQPCRTVFAFPRHLPDDHTFGRLDAEGDGRDCPSYGARCNAGASNIEVEPAIAGVVELSAVAVERELFKLMVRVENLTPPEPDGSSLDRALWRSLLSVHALLRAEAGRFVSLADPPDWHRAAAADCRNTGLWPVLVGPPGGAMLLAAPIILGDYPQIAPESPGDLFDGTEIDELLTLRIQTLTDEEKREMAAAGLPARRLLQRTESLSDDQLLQLHGRLQRQGRLHKHARKDGDGSLTPADESSRPDDAHAAAGRFQPGDRVRLRPRPGADAFDLLLDGQTATVVAVERDFENRCHLAVVIDDDPGKDLGVQGHPAHRFYYRPEEVERIAAPEDAASSKEDAARNEQ